MLDRYSSILYLSCLLLPYTFPINRNMRLLVSHHEKVHYSIDCKVDWQVSYVPCCWRVLDSSIKERLFGYLSSWVLCKLPIIFLNIKIGERKTFWLFILPSFHHQVDHSFSIQIFSMRVLIDRCVLKIYVQE